ncbi:LLM class flavin-dependent oxidoreductase [Ruegeria sp. Ofav3-42]|uniref:LLM class flavin-dependent oxidoreductase n=1 Tax=Ruegeria sp. Ofav3-42 TaxID=2917759 RepID=UPI001EF40FC8|nr:LLM class flavin-dependent oxidoreductase [Ruegeria sp. Ofav3-42]MCG7522451.1 LLM class flavin-dependent oxidoreductase [Ruegeria sp. Ofav3-42]
MLRFYCAHEMPFQISAPADSLAPFLIPNSLDDGSGAHALSQYLEQLALAEAEGFDAVYLPRSAGGAVSMLSDPFAVAALAAARTSRIGIAVGEIALGLLDPVDAAQRVAMLDMISGGRAEAGITFGSGAAFWAMTARPGRARLQFAEAAALFLQSLREAGPRRFEGEYFMQRHLNPWPKASDGLPCFVSGPGCPETRKAAEMHGLDYLPDADDPERKGSMVHVNVFVGDADVLTPHLEQARAVGATTPNYQIPPGYLTAQQYRATLTKLARDPLMFTGNADDVTGALRTLIEVRRPTALVIHPHVGSMPHDMACANIRAVAQILPALKSATPAFV